MNLEDFFEEQKKSLEEGTSFAKVNQATLHTLLSVIEQHDQLNFSGAYQLWRKARQKGALVADTKEVERVEQRYEQMQESQPQAREFAKVLRKAYELNQ